MSRSLGGGRGSLSRREGSPCHSEQQTETANDEKSDNVKPYTLTIVIPCFFFRKTNVSIRVHKNGHKSTCDQYSFMILAPLDSACIELSIHAKNSNL